MKKFAAMKLDAVMFVNAYYNKDVENCLMVILQAASCVLQSVSVWFDPPIFKFYSYRLYFLAL